MPMLKNYIIPDWPAPDKVRAYTTTRMQGHSQAPYDAFNLSLSVGDSDYAVNKNREQLCKDLDLPTQPIWLKQVHGNRVVNMTDQVTEKTCADACFTSKTNTICVINTADCLPILICNQEASEIAAIHAGWRGLLNNVIEETIRAMSSESQTLMAWLGPAIGPDVFEVNESIKVDFLHNNPQNIDCFKTSNENKIFADIYGLASNHLKRCGIKKIVGGDYCTYTQKNLFYSYRRDRGLTGRMATLIFLHS